MIAQVCAHAGTVTDNGKLERSEVIGGPYPGELEDLRRLECSRAKDDIPVSAELSRHSLHRTRHANGPAPIENDSGNDGAGDDAQICPLFDWREERPGRADAFSMFDCCREVP